MSDAVLFDIPDSRLDTRGFILSIELSNAKDDVDVVDVGLVGDTDDDVVVVDVDVDVILIARGMDCMDVDADVDADVGGGDTGGTDTPSNIDLNAADMVFAMSVVGGVDVDVPLGRDDTIRGRVLVTGAATVDVDADVDVDFAVEVDADLL